MSPKAPLQRASLNLKAGGMKIAPVDGDTAPETRALDYLLDVGWRCAHVELTCTTPTTVSNDGGGQLIIDRCLTHGPLVPETIWVDTSNLPYSDHRVLTGTVAFKDRSE
jgi:hypothetical protein